MLKAIIIDQSAISRDLLNAILLNENYEIVGHSGTANQGLALAIKHKPQIVCADMDVINTGNFLPSLREALPKSLIFMVSSEVKADTLKDAIARGVHGVIIKPFNSVKVASTIKNAVLAYVKRQQAAQAQTSEPSV